MGRIIGRGGISHNGMVNIQPSENKIATQMAFHIPYVFANWPDAHDPFTHIAVTGVDVPAFAEPADTAPVVARLTHEIVALPAWNPANGFHQIALADGTTAFVSERQLRSPIDYRAGFVREQGEWMLEIFIAGD